MVGHVLTYALHAVASGGVVPRRRLFADSIRAERDLLLAVPGPGAGSAAGFAVSTSRAPRLGAVACSTSRAQGRSPSRRSLLDDTGARPRRNCLRQPCDLPEQRPALVLPHLQKRRPKCFRPRAERMPYLRLDPGNRAFLSRCAPLSLAAALWTSRRLPARPGLHPRPRGSHFGRGHWVRVGWSCARISRPTGPQHLAGTCRPCWLCCECRHYFLDRLLIASLQ